MDEQAFELRSEQYRLLAAETADPDLRQALLELAEAYKKAARDLKIARRK